MHTPWGYQTENLPPLMDPAAFDLATGNQYSGDLRKNIALEAASAAIRNECGWHIAPSLECTAQLTANGRLAVLPANLVTEISELKENGQELGAGDFEARADGLIRRTGFKNWARGWGAIEVSYMAGYEQTPPEIEAALLRMVEAALSVPTGVNSESAGGVSISYSTQAAGIASSLIGGMASTLAPYRLVRAYAS